MGAHIRPYTPIPMPIHAHTDAHTSTHIRPCKGLRIFARRYYVHCRKIKQLTKETYLDDETERIWDDKMEMRKYQRDLIECKMDQLNAHLSMIKKVMKYNDDRWNYYAHWKAEIIIATMGVVEN